MFKEALNFLNYHSFVDLHVMISYVLILVRPELGCLSVLEWVRVHIGWVIDRWSTYMDLGNTSLMSLLLGLS